MSESADSQTLKQNQLARMLIGEPRPLSPSVLALARSCLLSVCLIDGRPCNSRPLSLACCCGCRLIKAKKDRGAAARRLDRAAGELRLLQRFRSQATAALRSKELQTQAARLAFEAAAEEVDEVGRQIEHKPRSVGGCV